MVDRRPRLVVLTSTFPIEKGDGTPSFVWDLAELESRKFETVVLTPCVPGAPSSQQTPHFTIQRFRYFPRRWEDLADGSILENLKARPSRWLQVLPFLVFEWNALRTLIRDFRPDVVHLHWLLPQGLVGTLASRRQVNVISTLGADVYALDRALWRVLKRIAIRRADVIFTLNRDMKSKLINLGAELDKIHLTSLPADLKVFREAALKHERVPGQILFVGRLAEKKGVDVLIEAVHGLPGNWSLHVVGDGPEQSRLVELSRADPRIQFLGKQPRIGVAAELAECEVFVMPSVVAASGDQEGQGVVLVEAMAAGCVIVASDLPGPRGVIEHGVNGVLVPSGDANAVRSALRQLLGDPKLRKDLGRAASEKAEEYSLENRGQELQRILERVLVRRSRRVR